MLRLVPLALAAEVWVSLLLAIVREGRASLIPSDWTAFAVGGHLAMTDPTKLYEAAAQLSEQLRLVHLTFGRSVTGAVHGLLPVIAPPWVNLLAAPFTLLGYTMGGRVWTLFELIILLAAALIVTGLRDARRAVIALAGVPALGLIMNGQVDAIAALGVALAWRLHGRGQRLWAGAALGLTLAKPQLFVGVAVVLILTRRWRVLAGWAAAGLALVAASTAVAPQLVPAWIQYAFGHAGQIGDEMGLVGLTDLWTGGLAGSLIAAAIGVAVTAWLARGREFAQAVALVLLGSLLAAPHALPPDLVLVPVALLIAGRDGIVRLVAVSAATVVVFAAPRAVGMGLQGQVAAALTGSLFLLMLMVDIASPAWSAGVRSFLVRRWRPSPVDAGPVELPVVASGVASGDPSEAGRDRWNARVGGFGRSRPGTESPPPVRFTSHTGETSWPMASASRHPSGSSARSSSGRSGSL